MTEPKPTPRAEDSTTTPAEAPVPKAFITYSWDDAEHQRWVESLARRLMEHGVEVTLDRWNLAPGDPIPAFLETAVRENDFVLVVCTPNYKVRSDDRAGGAGSEGHIMTAEIYNKGNHRKYIPLWRSGTWAEAAPSWLLGSYKIDLREGPSFEPSYRELLRTVHGARPRPPVRGPRPKLDEEAASP